MKISTVRSYFHYLKKVVLCRIMKPWQSLQPKEPDLHDLFERRNFFLKSFKNRKYIKYIIIISICVMILAVIGISVYVLKACYFNNLESVILVKQEVSGVWIKSPVEYVYYEVNTEYGILKSIDENEYTERSRVQIEYRETTLKESQEILESQGYDVLMEYGEPCLVTLNNNIYFAVDDGNGGQSYLKYDNAAASVDNHFSPELISKGNIRVLSKLKEIASVDTYPELTNCVQRYETNQVEYGEIMISNGRIVVCMVDNSEPYTANRLLYEYDQSSKEFKLLCKPSSSRRIEDIIFL